MKNLSSLLILALLTAAPIFTTANDQGDSYIEYANIILNLEKSEGTDNAHGYLLATPCSNCQQIRIEVNQKTRIFLNGKPTNLDELALKIDWQGMVFFNSGTPAIATRLMLQ